MLTPAFLSRRKSPRAARRHAGRVFADLYEGNAIYNATEYAHAGRPFVILKASQGTGHVDSMHATRCEYSHGAGLPVGHYHYLDPNGDAEAEARFFWDTVRPHFLRRWEWGKGHDTNPLSHTDFILADIEGAGWRDARGNLKAFESEIVRLSNETLIGYGSRSFILEHDLHLSRGDKWWVADYGAFPTGMGTREIWSHQFTDAYTLPGIGQKCDASVLVDKNAIRYWELQ